MAGDIREALEVVWKKSQNRQKEEKKLVPKWELVLDPALTPNRDRFDDEITCDNDFGGSQVVKKEGPKRAPKMDPIPPHGPLEPQPREGGRGKGKPSQLEDWKSLKPKPPQPRGLVGLRHTRIQVQT